MEYTGFVREWWVIAWMIAGTFMMGSLARAQESAAQHPEVSQPAEREATISRGIAPPGHAIAVQPRGGEPSVLCEPECELTLPRSTEVRAGVRRGADIEWSRDFLLETDLRLDVRIQDHSGMRALAYTFLIGAGVLLGATAIVGIVTEPQPPEYGWFGANHALVFAGIAGGVVLAFGVPGVAIALAFERDTPALELVPEDGT